MALGFQLSWVTSARVSFLVMQLSLSHPYSYKKPQQTQWLTNLEFGGIITLVFCQWWVMFAHIFLGNGMQGQESTLGVFLKHYTSYFLSPVFFIEAGTLQFNHGGWWVSSKDLPISVFPILGFQIHTRYCGWWLFMCVLGIQTQILNLAWQTLLPQLWGVYFIYSQNI